MINFLNYKESSYDNAWIESFHAVLKKVVERLFCYLDFESIQLALFQYIESCYNHNKIHRSIEYQTL